MKSTLSKELCEHERAGSDKGFGQYRHARNFIANDEGDNVPSFEGMKKRYGYDRKEFGENLTPLWGAVRKAVGRPWNKFYSELCENFDMRSDINQHIVLHLEQHVATKTNLVDGEVHVMVYRAYEPLKESGCEYFVHPKTGLLCKNKFFTSYRQNVKERKKKAAAELKSIEHFISKTEVLRKIEDIWFIFTLKEIPKGTYHVHSPVGKIKFENDSGEEVYWAELSTFEKEKHGLRVYRPDRVKDIFFGYTVYVDQNGTFMNDYRGSGTNGVTGSRPQGFYHASRRTASRKELKKAGIV